MSTENKEVIKEQYFLEKLIKGFYSDPARSESNSIKELSKFLLESGYTKHPQYETVHSDCPLCKGEISSFAGDPSKWPVYLPNNDESGEGQYYCMGCVTERFYQHPQLQPMRLKWENDTLSGFELAETPLGIYGVGPEGALAYKGSILRKLKDKTEAKVFAQSDFDTRVLACMESKISSRRTSPEETEIINRTLSRLMSDEPTSLEKGGENELF